jgi:hypothetical protein
MILDGTLMFDNPSSLAIGAGTQASANVIDLVNPRNLAVGTEALDILAQVTTTFTSGGAGTLAYSVQGSIDNSAWTTMVTSPTYALANSRRRRADRPLSRPRPRGWSGAPALSPSPMDGWHGGDDCWSGHCGYRPRSSA